MGTEDAATRETSFRELAEILVVFLAAVYMPLILYLDPSDNGFMWGDTIYYQLALDSLIADGDLEVANNLSPGAVIAALRERQLSVGSNGELVPKHQLMLSFCAYPFYRLLGIKGLLAFNVFCTFAVLLGVLALCRQWVEAPYALAATFLIGVATLFLIYVYNFSADVLTTAFLVWSAVCARWRRFFAAALLLSLSVATKISSLPAAGGVGLLLAWQGWRAGLSPRVVTAVVGGVILGILPLLAVNQVLFGTPWESGYSHIAMLTPEGGFAEYGLEESDFNRPWLRGSWDVLFSFPQGLFVSNPLLLAVFGFPFVYRLRRDPFLLLLMFAAVVQVLVIARYSMWDTSRYSNRFLMPSVALIAPHVAMVLAAGMRRLTQREP